MKPTFKPKFLVAPGVTRPATAEDKPYLDRLYPLIDEAAREDPGEDNEPPNQGATVSTLQLYHVSIGHRAWSELQLLNPPDDEPRMTVTGEAMRAVVLSGSREALSLLVARADAMIECLHSNLPDSRMIDYGRQALINAAKRMHAELAAH